MKVIKWSIIGAGLFFSSLLLAQDSIQNPVRYVTKPAYLSDMQPSPQKARTVRLADSLAMEITQLKAQNDSLLVLINDEMAKTRSAELKYDQLKVERDDMSKDLEDARGDQLQTSHTSSILLIFNVIVGLILLVALFWMYSRKKAGPGETEEPIVFPAADNSKDHVETRMERIEKLGKLRDKGLLTEEEFQVQKKQILG